MTQLWYPGVEGPHEDFVRAVHRQIEQFATRAGIERPFVSVEIADGSRLALDSISPEPGYGFVTLRPHPAPEQPEEIVVPVGSIRRIELASSGPGHAQLGFSLPRADEEQI